MENWRKTFWNKHYYDLFPRQTKILTFTFMPIVCILFISISIYLNKLANRTEENYQFIKGTITKAIRKDQARDGNETSNFTFNIKLDQVNLFLKSTNLQDTTNISLIKAGKVAEIYFDRSDNTITQIYIGDQKILNINDYNAHIKSSRNVTLVFGVIFTFWFIYRIYRYKKYGNLD